MSRLLPAGLAAKISATGQTPEISATIGANETALAPFASGGTPGRSAAIISSSGKILRASLPQEAPAGTVTVQRITPSFPTSWTAAGVTVTTTAAALAGVCLVQTGGTTRCFYQRSSDNLVSYKDSTDDGLTWGAETSIPTLPGLMPNCAGICADSITQVWAAQYLYETAATALYRSHNTGSWSAWSVEGPTSPGWAAMRGVNVAVNGATRAFAAGMGMRGYDSGVSAASFTWDGTTYSDAEYIQQLDSPAAGISCAYPDIWWDGSRYYATVTMTSLTPTDTRTAVYTSTDAITWIPLLHAGTAFAYGAHFLIVAGVTYIFDAATCYTTGGSTGPLDVTDDVLSLEITEKSNEPASLTLLLSNANGQHTLASHLADNTPLTLSLGYGGQAVETHTFYIDDWQLTSSATIQTLTIAARDYLKLLDYTSTRMIVWQNLTVAQMLVNLADQAGVSIGAPPATPQFSETLSCFLISPGEPFLHALNRLSTVFGFMYVAGGGTSVLLMDPQASDPSTWSYGSEILAASRGREADAANVVRVTGAQPPTTFDPAWSEATDGADIALTGQERFRNVVDRLLTTSEQCAIRAGLELRAEQRTRTHAQLTVALNPAHQVGDVIDATDTGCGMAGTHYRISGISWIARLASGEWEQHLTLEDR